MDKRIASALALSPPQPYVSSIIHLAWTVGLAFQTYRDGDNGEEGKVENEVEDPVYIAWYVDQFYMK